MAGTREQEDGRGETRVGRCFAADVKMRSCCHVMRRSNTN